MSVMAEDTTETCEIRYKGKSISDVLNMTIDQA